MMRYRSAFSVALVLLAEGCGLLQDVGPEEGDRSEAGADVADGGGGGDAGAPADAAAGMDGSTDADIDRLELCRVDAGPPLSPADATYVLGAPGDDCSETCAAAGLGCAGYGVVALDCGVTIAKSYCSNPRAFVLREFPDAEPRCLICWGDSRVCDYNYNVYNSFCCRCR